VAAQASFSIGLAKGGASGSGTGELRIDTVAPLDCAAGSGTTIVSGSTSLALPQDSDTDSDTCPDHDELGPEENQGGMRDPFNPYDFFDADKSTSAPGLQRVSDILKVVQAYFKDDNDATPGLPPYASGYDPDTDRTYIGPNVWNLGPPNGQQRIDDVLNAVKQYFHDCP
jgi:hypothetical protein